MQFQRKSHYRTISILALSLLPVTAHATSYTWTGTTSSAWNVNSNWGGTGFPNAYTDQATIPSAGANRPVSLSTTALLGGGGTALTISGASSGTTSNSLDITSTGLLGMQGGISIGSRRTLTIEGTLRNDAASSGTTYTITGSPTLNGGTISSLNGGIWNLSNGITGYGTISAPITTTSTISDNVANQTLHITGNVTSTAQRGLGGNSYTSGAVLSIEGGTIYGGTATGGLEGGIDNYNLVNLRGNFNNIQLFNDGAYNLATPGGWNAYNLTGNSSWNNGALNIINFNGYKMDVTGSVTNYASLGNGINVGTGTLNNPGYTLATISNGNTITMTGGQITGAAGSNGFSFGTNLRLTGGNNTISTPVTITPSGSLAISSGATLAINNTTLNNTGGATVSNSGTVQVTNSQVNWGNFTNNGAYKSDPSTQTFNNLTVGSTGYLQGVAGDVYQITGDFINNSTQNTTWDTTQVALEFLTGTSSNHNFALAGADLGQTLAGLVDNFAWDSLDITGQTLNLSDGNGTPGGALYLEDISGLIFSGNAITNINGNGFNIYYNPSVDVALRGQTFALQNGGILAPEASPVPEPATMLLFGTGLFGLAAARRKKTS